MASPSNTMRVIGQAYLLKTSCAAEIRPIASVRPGRQPNQSYLDYFPCISVPQSHEKILGHVWGLELALADLIYRS